MMQDVVVAGAQAAAIYDASQAAQGGTANNASTYAAVAAGVVGGPMGALLGKGIVGALGLGDDYVFDEGRTIFNETFDEPPIQGEIKGVEYTTSSGPTVTARVTTRCSSAWSPMTSQRSSGSCRSIRQRARSP